MTRRVLLLLVVMLGCAPRHLPVAMRAPNPNGCYVMLFEQPEFKGVGDLLNGPGKWPNLETMNETNYRWTDRLRSLRIVPTEIVKLYANPVSRPVAEFRRRSRLCELKPGISASVQSLTIALLSNSDGLTCGLSTVDHPSTVRSGRTQCTELKKDGSDVTRRYRFGMTNRRARY